MGNTDSTNGGNAKPYQQRAVSRSETASSMMMIMHCRPNRIRALDEFPDTMSLSGFDHSPNVSICVNGSVKQRSLSPQQYSDEGGYASNDHSNQLSNVIRERRSQGLSMVLKKRLTSSTTPDNTSLPSNDPNAALLGGRSTASIRRVKSLRMSSGGNANNSSRAINASFRRQACPFTGLTERQKKLIALRWRDDQSTVALRRAAADIFGAVFAARPTMLRFIGLRRFEHDVDARRWRHHLLFRRHVQRFCDTFNEVVRALQAPALSADSLMQFGADYEMMRRLYYRNDEACCSTTGSRQRREWSCVNDCGRRVGDSGRRRCRATTEKPQCRNHDYHNHHGCCDDDSSADDDDSIPTAYWDSLVRAFGDTVRRLNVAEEPMGLTASETPKLPLSSGESLRFVLPPSPSPTPTTIDSADVDASPPLAFDAPPSAGPTPVTLPLHHVGAVAAAAAVNMSTTFLYPSPPESARDSGRIQCGNSTMAISRHGHFSRSFNTGGPRGGMDAMPCRATPSPKFLQRGDEYSGGSLLTPNRSASARILRAKSGRFLNSGGNGTTCQCQSGGISRPSVDDWHLLAVYVVGQIRFGYELERQLQCAAERLALMFDIDQASCGGGSGGGSEDDDRSDENDESEECASD